jgi:hypothetical protein
MVTWPHYFGPVTSQYNMTGAHGRDALLTSWQPGSKKERNKKGISSLYPFKGAHPVT